MYCVCSDPAFLDSSLTSVNRHRRSDLPSYPALFLAPTERGFPDHNAEGTTHEIRAHVHDLPALVRLIQRERLVSRDIIEGYLSRTPDHLQFVRIEPDGCTVLLVANSDGTKTEDRAKVSAAQAKALSTCAKAESCTGAMLLVLARV